LYCHLINFAEIFVMLSEFNTFVKHHSMFENKQSLLLALSGGKDSICLFYLLLQTGYSFSVAHCNFQLRGKDSDEDEKFVIELAKKHDIPCYVQKFNTEETMKTLHLSLQESARKLRYDWFKELMNLHGFDKLLTAHHLSDNTETFFINLMRNTGISGLHGIPLVSNHLARPLMFATHHQIEEYLKNKGIKFREDESNSEDKYLRNKIRHHLTPALEDIQSNIHQTIFQVSQNLYSFENLTQELLKKQWQEVSHSIDSHIEINKKELLKMNNASTFLFYNCRELGFNHEQIQQFLEKNLQNIGKLIETKTHQMIMEREQILIIPKTSTNLVDLKIENFNENYTIIKQKINFEVLKLRAIDLKNSSNIYLDYNKIKLPLFIRNWQAGDKIKPLGMLGHKNISDILTDQKVKHIERASRLILLDDKNNVIALLPNLISEEFKITDQTTQILCIQII
jgi:tRNA(Ile)-lysidine synthase